jgi:hypothetical protein
MEDQIPPTKGASAALTTAATKIGMTAWSCSDRQHMFRIRGESSPAASNQPPLSSNAKRTASTDVWIGPSRSTVMARRSGDVPFVPNQA